MILAPSLSMAGQVGQIPKGNVCVAIGDMARDVMNARQRGVSAQLMANAIRGQVGEEVGILVIRDAFTYPIHLEPPYQSTHAEEFAALWFDNCLHYYRSQLPRLHYR